MPSDTHALAVAAGLALLVVAGPAAAQDVSPPRLDAVETGVESDFGSLYLFRGLVYSAGAVVQSKAWLTSGGFALYGWTNVAVPAAPGARTFDEVDAGTSYALAAGKFRVAPALDVYMYRLSDGERTNGAASHTIEVSLALSYTHGGTTVSSKHVVDAGSYRGAYFTEVGVSHSRALTSRTVLDVAALVGGSSRRFNRSYFGPDVRGIGLAAASVSVTRRLRGSLYLRPHVELSVIPNPRLRAAVSRPLNAVLGLAIGVVR